MNTTLLESHSDLTVVDYAYCEKSSGKLNGLKRFLAAGVQLFHGEQQKLSLLKVEKTFNKFELATFLHFLAGGIITLGYFNFSTWSQTQEVEIYDVKLIPAEEELHWLSVLHVALQALSQMAASLLARLELEALVP